MSSTKRNVSAVKKDAEARVAMVTKAMGNRTRQQFAKICGTSPPTMTRILDKDYQGTFRPDLLKAIAENAAPGSGVTLEALMLACGLIQEPPPEQGMDVVGYEDVVSSIIFDELLGRKADVRLTSKNYYIGKDFYFRPDTAIITNATGSRDGVWAFEILPPYTINLASEFDYSVELSRENRHRLSTKIMHVIAGVLLAFMNLSKNYPPVRFSIVTTEPAAYSWLVEEFGETCVSVDLSFILVNLTKYEVADEYVLPKTNGQKTDSYFRIVKPLRDSEADDKINITELEEN